MMVFAPAPADNTDVFVRAAWLYTRASESVRLEVREEPTQCMLAVHGPGAQAHHEVCRDYFEATQAQLACEARLLAQGFILEGFDHWEPPRRTSRAGASGGERRGAAIPGPFTFEQPEQR